MLTSNLCRLLLVCLVCLVAPGLRAELPAKSPPQNLDLYLLMGGENMAGRPDASDGGEILEHCYLLNAKGEWEPARSNIGPGYSFAKKMLENKKDISIGLIINAGKAAGAPVKNPADPSVIAPLVGIDAWFGKSEYYWGARRRAKSALAQGTLKGVLWLQEDAADKADYLDKLLSLIANLRADLGDTRLPFIAGQVLGSPELNARIAKLPDSSHSTAFVSSEGLSAEGTHFDAKSQALLGERYAEKMVGLQATVVAPKPPSDLQFIDPHVHAMSVTPTGLEAVAKWMQERNVERCIVSPLSHKGSRPQNEQERTEMLANFRQYKGKIDRMALLDAGEVPTVDEAVAFLKREIADGAVGFGEHYGVGLMFDDPKNLLIYEACEKVGLPVMFHIDQNKNMVETGMERVDRVLKMYPKCKLVAHAYWWRQLQNGACDRQLQEHPNLYADMSGHVVISVLNRDRKYAREFLIRNQDKILWATDEGWWSFGSNAKQMNQHYTFLEELNLPDEVRHKIYRGNAEKVFALKKEAK